MTVSASTNRWSFSGNDATLEFAIGKIFAAADVSVYLIASGGGATLLTITTHYSVSDLATAAATVTMVTAPATGETLLVIRNQPLVQNTDIKNQGAFYPEVHENVFDKLFMMIARLWHRLSRSISQSDTSTASLDLTLPAPAAGAAIGWNAGATGLANVTNISNAQFASDAEAIAKSLATVILTPSNLAAIGGSATFAGLLELATDAEAQTGTDTARAITPANLQAVTGTETRKGVLELATNAEVTTGTDTARAVTPAGLAQLVASDTVDGLIEIATQAEQETGTDVVRAVTPGRQHFHASAAKFWLKAGDAGNILASNNITSLADTGTGDVAITIADDISGVHYAVVTGGERTSSTGTATLARDISIKTGTLTAGVFSLECWDKTATTNVIKDPASWHCVGFGDL